MNPTRAKLLEVAGEVFAEKGYFGATIRDIADRSGANIAAVNYHFGDKLGLYSEILQQSAVASQVLASGAVLDQDASPEEMFRLAIKTRLRSIVDNNLQNLHFRIMIHELAQPSPVVSRFLDEISAPMYRRMLDLVGSLTGMPPDDEQTQLCAQSILGQMFLYVIQAPLLVRIWPGLKLTPEKVDRIADHIAEFSLPYIRRLRASRKGV